MVPSLYLLKTDASSLHVNRLHMKALIVIIFFAVLSVSAQISVPISESTGEARNKTYDVLHYKIVVSFDELNKKVTGTTSITFIPYGLSLSTAEFDAEGMNFYSVTLGKKPLRYDSLAKTIRVYLNKSYSYKDTLTVSIAYDCIPKKGVYFVQPDSAHPDKPQQIWTQGEDMDNHHWFPCWDFPNDKATSEIIATVRSSYEFLSNGKLISRKSDPKSGTTTFHWKQSKPHVAYLIMFAAGEYSVIRETVDGIPLEYYVYKHHVDDAKASFAHTAPMMKFFNETIGFRYPWEKYAQVIVADFMNGGMENTSASTLMDRITVLNARTRVEESATSLIAHELSHQWWGDVVTTKDWRHLWLNEAFASYYDPLYFEFAFGNDEFINIIHGNQQAGIISDKTRGRKPIVSNGSYGSNLYPRGASVLHMLRFVLGDELFRKAMKHYITKHQFQSVETNDLKLAIEEATGQNLFWFFDQWVYKAGYPKFEITSRYNNSLNNISLTVAQTQTLDSLTGLFITPVDIEIVSGGSREVHRIIVSERESTYTLPVRGKPSFIVFDKDNWLLKEAAYPGRSLEEWAMQAASGSDVVARKTAVDSLAKYDTAGVYTSAIAAIAQRDPFWGVRQAAVQALGSKKKQTPEMQQWMLAALRDPSPKVRSVAASMLGSFKNAEVAAALRAALSDSSYTTEAHALTSLTSVDSVNAIPYIKERLHVWSYRNRVANAALEALAELDSSSTVAIALQKAAYGAEPMGRNNAFSILRKFGGANEKVLSFSVSLLNDASASMRSRAASLLGEYGDVSHIPALKQLAEKSGDWASGTAQKAISAIEKRTNQ